MDLATILTEWRQSRSAELSEVIELLDGNHPRATPGKSVADRLARWRDLEAAGRPEDVGELMRTLTDVPGHALDERIDALLARDPDPRIAMGAITALEQSFAPRGATWHHFRALSTIIVEHGDVRVLARLEAKVTGELRKARLSRKNLWAKTAHELRAALAGRRSSDPARDAELLARARALRAVEPPPVDGAALLAAIYEHPADDGAREVYADFLIERGDPRGELITLQLANASPKRQNELLRTYGDDWLGPLAPLVMKDGRVWERGFLHAARIATKPADIVERAAGAREWATLVELDLQSWAGPPAILEQPTLRALRVVRGVNPSWMTTTLPPTIERLGFHRGDWFLRNGPAALARFAPECPWRVKHLELPACRLPADFDAFWSSDLVRNLETLTIALAVGPGERQQILGPQLAQLVACPVPIVHVARSPERDADWRFELVREATGHRRIRIEALGGMTAVASLADLLFAIETHQVSRLELANLPPDAVAVVADQTGWRCEAV